MRIAVLQAVCAVNGLGMFGLGVYGLVAPLAAVRWMAAIEVPFNPDVVSLIHMHVATDLGLGVGFLLAAWRPHTSFAAFVLCLMANVSHGLVHVVELAQGRHGWEHHLAITALVVVSAVLAALYPWGPAWRHFAGDRAA